MHHLRQAEAGRGSFRRTGSAEDSLPTRHARRIKPDKIISAQRQTLECRFAHASPRHTNVIEVPPLPRQYNKSKVRRTVVGWLLRAESQIRVEMSFRIDAAGNDLYSTAAD